MLAERDMAAAGTTSDIRTVEIRPPSAMRETAFVARAAFHIVFWSALVIFGRPSPADPTAATESPFEVRFDALDGKDQRMVRLLQEGLVEAERRRTDAGMWPTAEALRGELVPPFAPDPIDDAGYTWRSIARPGIVNYVGTPAAGSGRSELVAIVTEPPPGTPNDPNAVVDEVHHRLADGTMVHVMVFLGPGLGEVTEPVAFVAAEAGWRRITTAAK